MLLIQEYLVEHDNNKKLHFPSRFTDNDKERIIYNYIIDEKSNPNYVKAIQYANNITGLPINAKIRNLAKQQYQKQMESLEKSDGGFRIKYGVAFVDDTQKPLKFTEKDQDGNFQYCYREDVVKNANDIELIQLFRDFFDFVGGNGLISLVNKNADSFFIDIFGIKTIKSYSPNTSFEIKQQIALMAIIGCVKCLPKEKTLESAVSKFYSEYLVEKYSYPSIQINIPSVELDYINKSKILLTEFDSVVKQYDLYVKEGEIDPDLLLYNGPTAVTDAFSLLDKKYVTKKDGIQELNTILYLFFSDQTLLNFVNPFKNSNYRTLYDLMEKEQVLYDNYEDFQKNNLDYLISHKLIYVNDGGFLQFRNKNRLKALKCLYYDEVLPFWNLSPEERIEVDLMIKDGWLETDEHLLSKPERDFYNYYLNNAQYIDGPMLRNLYIHGLKDSTSRQQSQIEYYQILLLFIMLLLKIEDDLLIAQGIFDFCFDANNRKRDV